MANHEGARREIFPENGPKKITPEGHSEHLNLATAAVVLEMVIAANSKLLKDAANDGSLDPEIYGQSTVNPDDIPDSDL